VSEKRVGDLTLKLIPNYGVDTRKIDSSRERYRLDGHIVSEKEALDILDDPTITDDSGLLRLTVVGTDDQRKAVLTDLADSPALAGFKGKLVVQDYDPSRWELQCGFQAKGTPTVYVQTPDGKVLHRQDDYRDGADGLKTALTKASDGYVPTPAATNRVRAADPSYDPKKDQDLRYESSSQSPEVSPALQLQNLPWYVWAGVAGLAYLLVKPGPNQKG
jgi:hypothetical protein